MSKRPADEQLDGRRSGAGPPNPFAGVSLLSPAAPAKLFTSAAPAQAAPGGSGFPRVGAGAAGGAALLAQAANPFAPAAQAANPFAPAAKDANPFAPAAQAANPFAPAAQGAKPLAPAAQGANPFTGLSLFSSAPGGGLFSAAAASLSPPVAAREARAEPAQAAKVAPDGPAEAAATPPKAAAQDVVEPEAELDGSAETGAAVEAAAAAAAEATAEVIPGGQEEEDAVFRTDCKLWKLVKEQAPLGQDVAGAAHAPAPETAGAVPGAAADDKSWRWQERGCGTLVAYCHCKTGDRRLVMHSKGVYKLLLNTPIFPTVKYEKLGQKSVRFVGIDEAIDSEAAAAKKALFCAFRVTLQNSDQRDRFLGVLRQPRPGDQREPRA